MSVTLVGVIGIFALVILLAMGMNIGLTMLAVGFTGFAYIVGIEAAMGLLKTVPFTNSANYALTVIPLFVLMGQFAFRSGMSEELYNSAHKWLCRLPGGLACATLGACAAFAAICGSTAATAATMGTVALPEMKRHGYDTGLSTGSIAAGGTLGILIPPSTGFILYGIIAEQSIGRLFAAGVFPGLVLVTLYILTVVVLVKRNPNLAPFTENFTLLEKIQSLKGIIGVLFLFVFVIGGMFSGLFTANEAAGAGAFIALVLMALRKKLTWQNFSLAIKHTVLTTSMIFLILIGAYVFGYFLAVTKIPVTLAAFVESLSVSRYIILLFVIVIYIILGCIMDSLAMVMLTVPIFLPIVVGLGFDPVWFGVVAIMVMEQGLITPPVGLNVYIIAGVADGVPLPVIFKGVAPFILSILSAIVIMIIFPQIALFLPNLFYN